MVGRSIVVSFLACALACSSSPSSPADAGAEAAACVPKTGYEQVAQPVPNGAADLDNVSLVLDAAGTPSVAWVAYDADSNGTLWFASYDPGTCAWRSPVQVAAVGQLDTTRDREVTMARDASSGHLAIGYQVISQTSSQVRLAQSDDGITWADELVAQKTSSEPGNVYRPTVALAGGKTYFAWYDSDLYGGGGANPSVGGGFIFGSRSGTSGTWATVNVPPVGDTALPGSDNWAPSIAVDANGNPALLSFAHTSDKDNNFRIVYWAAGQAHAVAVFDSQGTQNDGGDASLTFEGTKPRVAATLQRGDTGTSVWFSGSNDGTTWSAPVELPADQGDTMGPWVSIASDDKGALSIATSLSGGNGQHTCGSPKLSTSTDDGATWSTCGPTLDPSITYAGRYVQAAYTPNGKRIAAFGVDQTGVWIWREP